MKEINEALELFKNNHNCCQSVIGALHNKVGVKQSEAINMASAFGGGITRQGLTCGAVTGAYMALGLYAGKKFTDINDIKGETFRLSQEFNNEFVKEHNTLICNELLNGDMSSEDGYKRICESGKFKTLCPVFVETATDISLRLINE